MRDPWNTKVAGVGDIFMSLIYTAALKGVAPLD
jgi:hypothetical protein